MKTIINMKDGEKIEYGDAAPSIDLNCLSLMLINDESECLLEEDVPLASIESVVFEP